MSRSRSSRGSPPGRSSLGGSQVRSRIVDSTPTAQGPPSTTPLIRPSISSSTSWAVVQLGRPERLALGAAMGMPASRMIASVTGWLGQRTATVSSPAVVSSGMMGRRFRIIVSGPGQNFLAST